MQGQRAQLVGKTFERLTVIRRAGSDPRGNALWECKCVCGGTKVAGSVRLIGGHVRSCGCLIADQCRAMVKAKDQRGEKNPRYRHGKFGTRIHKIWDGMIQRCYNPKSKDFKHWGERGIVTCPEWRDFINFYRDMGDAPEGKSLGRIDNNAGYSKNNCRWETQIQQHRNKRNNTMITLRGKTQCLSAWLEELKLSAATYGGRIRNLGMSQVEALTTPVNLKYSRKAVKN